MKGNLIALAVAFVIGAAIVALVNALVGDLVMPLIAAIVGKTDFRELTFTIHNSIFYYGSFISALITFVSIAAAVFFFIVKPVDAVKARFAKPDEEAAPSDEERRHQELLAAVRGLTR